MKIYKVKVNGKIYEVELESVTEKAEEIHPERKPEEKPAGKAPVSGGSLTEVKAPMQGTIIDTKVQIGNEVKKGQTVLILEAMKLENDIVAPVSGIVKEILVAKGQSVKNQQILMLIE